MKIAHNKDQIRALIRFAGISNGLSADALDNVEIKICNRTKRYAGKAIWFGSGRRQIKICAKVLGAGSESFQRETVLHEACHIIAGIKAGHGDQWIQAMKRCGIEDPKQHYNTHLDLDPALKPTFKRYVYTCKCTEHYLTGFKHNRIQEGSRRYLCALCKTPLIDFQGDVRM